MMGMDLIRCGGELEEEEEWWLLESHPQVTIAVLRRAVCTLARTSAISLEPALLLLTHTLFLLYQHAHTNAGRIRAGSICDESTGSTGSLNYRRRTLHNFLTHMAFAHACFTSMLSHCG